jgi:hypothetical protein
MLAPRACRLGALSQWMEMNRSACSRARSRAVRPGRGSDRRIGSARRGPCLPGQVRPGSPWRWPARRPFHAPMAVGRGGARIVPAMTGVDHDQRQAGASGPSTAGRKREGRGGMIGTRAVGRRRGACARDEAGKKENAAAHADARARGLGNPARAEIRPGRTTSGVRTSDACRLPRRNWRGYARSGPIRLGPSRRGVSGLGRRPEKIK